MIQILAAELNLEEIFNYNYFDKYPSQSDVNLYTPVGVVWPGLRQ